MTRNQLTTIFQTYAAANNGPVVLPSVILRFIIALIAKAAVRAGVPDLAAPSAPVTKVNLISFVKQLSPGNGYLLEWSTGITMLVSAFIRRFARENIAAPPVDQGGGGQPTFDTTLTGPSQTAAGVTLTSGGNEVFKFNGKAAGGSAPANMHVFVNDEEIASVDFLDRYQGAQFSITAGGATYVGTFSNGANVSLG